MKKQDLIAKVYPLTPLQEGMLFHAVKDKEAGAYYLQLFATIQGDLDLSLFTRSLEKLVENHDVLRTVFLHENLQRPRQIVFKERKISLHRENISQMSEEEQTAYVHAYARRTQELPFDLSKDVLMRAAIFETGKDTYRFVWAFHHIIVDGWSLGILVQKLLGYYASLKRHGSIPTEAVKPYSDYIKWLEKQDKEAAIQYWKGYLQGYEQLAEFPKRSARSESTPKRHAELQFTLDTELTSSLMQIARSNQSTLSSVFQAIWALLVSKYKNTDDVVFGSVVSGRPPQIKDIEKMVGLFINTLPTRIRTRGDLSFLDLVKQVQQNSLASSAYDYAPLYEIQSQTYFKQDLLDHLVTFENYPASDAPELEKQLGFRFRMDHAEEQTTFALNVVAAVTSENQLIVKLSYDSSVYEAVIIENMAAHIQQIAIEVSAHPEQAIKHIAVITEAEKKRLIVDYNDTRSDYPRDRMIHELIDDQAEHTPRQVAVICGGDQLTYHELLVRSNQLAHALRKRGVGKGDIVAILADHSIELIVGLLAVLKAGGTYLPIDPTYPQDRIHYLLEDSQTRMLLTQDHLLQKGIPGHFAGDILLLQDPLLYQGSADRLESVTGPTDLAYLMYTSGSTGKPKGAMITHQGLVNYIWWAKKVYVQNDPIDFPLYSSISFDLTVTSIFTPLISGTSIHVYPGEDKVQCIQQIFADNRVGIIKLTPTHLKLIEHLDGKQSKIRRMVVGGENLTSQLAHTIYQNFGDDLQIFNEYGPTETVVGCMTYVYHPKKTWQDSVPIGVPADNVQIYLLDEALMPVPVGVIGEMYISGDGVAQGYWNRAELSAEKFLPNPFIPGTRMYRTGDLAKWLPDGNMEYIGRIDHQVKIRGHRIELGEIETQLLRYPFIQEAVVIADADLSGQQALLAYYVSERDLTVSELREHLGNTLPAYMVPSYFLKLESIPLTANGKLERKRLPKPDGMVNTGSPYVAPRNLIEMKIAEIWQTVLGLQQVGMEDHFFDLGGHSLKAMTVTYQISKAFDIQLPIHLLFEKPTVSELSAHIAKLKGEVGHQALMPAQEQPYYPVTSAQKRMYIIRQQQGADVSYNMPGVMMLEGKIDVKRLEQALNTLVNRHEILRTSFHSIQGEIVQKIHAEIKVEIDYRQSSEDQWEQWRKTFIQPFELDEAPLFRVALVRLEEERHALLMDMHHIISDGVSSAIFFEEWFRLYNGEMLPQPSLHYKDFAVWQQDFYRSEAYHAQKSYWLMQFEGDLPILQLPTDYPRPSLQSFEGSRLSFGSGSQLKSELQRLASQTGTTLYMVLLAAYQVFLSKYTGQEDLVVGTPIAGRSHADVQDMMGMFVNTLALRSQPLADKSFQQFLQDVKHHTLQAFAHQDFPFEALVEALQIPRDRSRNPLFDTMFVMQSLDRKSVAMNGLTITPYLPEVNLAKLDLTLEAHEQEDEILFSLEYATKLFASDTAERMIGHFLQVLRTVVDQPEVKLADISLLIADEKERMLMLAQTTACPVPESTLHAMFEAQASRTPQQIALEYDGQTLSYQQLNEKANLVAHALKQKGVETDQVVGIMVNRSLEMVIGILGILKAGAAYLPMDPNTPGERIAYMLQDSKAQLVLMQGDEKAKQLPAFVTGLDLAAITDGSVPASHPDDSCQPHHLAYVIYTSGTTGNPKGVMVEHRTILNSLQWKQSAYRPDDKCLLFLSYAFDAFVESLFTPLITGATVVLATDEMAKDPILLRNAISASRITQLTSVPSLYQAILECSSPEDLQTLRVVTLGGERLTEQLVEKSKQKNPQLVLMNEYGPTECSVVATCHENVQPGAPITIGRPITNVSIYILDRNHMLLPVGVIGELCIGGSGLARGYLNNHELTREKFIPNPFQEGELLYKTGDLARYKADGSIDYIGRTDDQVKVRGYRIEIGEIETVLLRQEKVNEAVVAVQEDARGEQFLAAYYTSVHKEQERELWRYAASQLPAYMVPTYFVQVDQMPVSANGKIDRSALPVPAGKPMSGQEYIAPENEVERQLVAIWEQVLGVQPIGTRDHFFELGGHSLRAMSVIAQIHRVFGYELPLKTFFEHPTIQAIAALIKKGEHRPYTTIEPVEQQPYYPLSSAQKRMYILRHMAESDTVYNMPTVMYIEGELDKDRFTEALRALVKRHEALRTSFHSQNGEPVQTIHQEVDLDVFWLKATEQETNELVKQFIRPFDLSRAPLFRAGLVELGKTRHLFLMDMHHIISDGVSASSIAEEIARLYAREELPALRIQYKDFAVWQNKRFETTEYSRQESFWLEQFAGEFPVLALPTDFPRPAVQSFVGARVAFSGSSELRNRLHRIARESGTTFFMVLLAAYNVLLSKYADQEDIVIGTPIAGRLHADLEKVVGMFVNTLALRNRPEKDRSFSEFLHVLKQNTLHAFDNQEYPFEALVEKLNIPRDMSRNPLFDVMFVLQNADQQTFAMDNLTFTPYEWQDHETKFDLTLGVLDQEDGILFTLEYRTALFASETIHRMAGHFLELLQRIADRPDAKIAELSILTQGEKQKLFAYGQPSTTTPYINQTLTALFEEQVRKSPDSTALEWAGEAYSYDTVNTRANQLAHTLISKGVSREQIVAIMAERSPEMIIGILAILKAGAAYLPVDPQYPQERIRYLLADSKSSLLLTTSKLAPVIPAGTSWLDIEGEQNYALDQVNPPAMNLDTDLAYVIYTSGTTGNPKGVMIEHRGIVNCVKWRREEYEFSGKDKALQVFSFSFDGFVASLFAPLLAGAVCVLPREEDAKDPIALRKLLQTAGITHFYGVPSLFQAILDCTDDKRMLHSLRCVTLGGEKLSPQLVEQIKTYNTAIEINNEYGPTENSVVTTIERSIEPGRPISIGRPIPNTAVYVLDQAHQMVPVGVAGELCIGGLGLARGYLHREELTAEKFIANPYAPHERLYLTGDMVKWGEDGRLYYIGRKDDQVKVRGYRIEIGEIEAALLSHEQVKEAVVTVYESGEEQTHLTCYYKAEKAIDSEELRAYLTAHLPAYMVPTFFILMESFPVTPNGKLDRKALPKPDANISQEAVYVGPRNTTEEKLVAIWQEVLRVERIGIRDNFFALGGHSLRAMNVVAQVHRELGIEMSMKMVFERQTIAELAAYLDTVSVNAYQAIEPVAYRERYPASSAQKRMYVLRQFEENNTIYNMPCLLLLEGQLDTERFARAVQELVDRHESLRTSFTVIDGELYQRIAGHVEVPLTVTIASEADIALKIKQFVRPFDLQTAPLLRMELLVLGEQKHLFMMDTHHIISDGVSTGILLEELARLYQGESLSARSIHYKDFAVWEQELLQADSFAAHESYWLPRFGDEIPVLDLTTDYPRPAIQTFEGAQHTIALDKKLTDELHQLARDSDSTLYMVLLAAYNVLLAKYTGQEDFVVGTPIAGRPHADLADVVGMFVNTLALRNQPTGEKTFLAFLAEVKQQTLDAYEHQLYPFDTLVDRLGIPRDLSRNPLFDTMFLLQNLEDSTSRHWGNVKVSSWQSEDLKAKFDLMVEAHEGDGEILLSFIYATRLFKEETILRMSTHFVNLLRAIIAQPNEHIRQFSLMDHQEKRLITEWMNGVTEEYPSEQAIPTLFEAQVLRFPEDVAVVGSGREFTYSELNDKANQLAHLLKKRGIGKNCIVGLFADRSVEMVIGILAILKAGSAYLPVDPEYPEERIHYMLDDGQVSIVLAQPDLINRLPVPLKAGVIPLSDEEWKEESRANPKGTVQATDLAYVMYTSGSTGKPKGVLVEHRNVVRLVTHTNYIQVNASDRMIQTGAVGFDAITFEIFGALLNGARLYLVEKDVLLNPSALEAFLHTHRITIMWLTSPLFNQLAEDGSSDLFGSLRALIVGGDVLSPKHIETVRERHPGLAIWNGYGPTENTTFSTCFLIDREYQENIPIGKPISHSTAYILDHDNQPVPVGVPGELCVGGDGVARGYLNQPELTAEKFVRDPFRPEERMYRTGDRARWLPDGSIEYLGRMDQQVKIRGYRIEPGEIEAVLSSHPEVKAAVVSVYEDARKQKALCAYFASNSTLSPEDLRDFAAKELPTYMVPASFVQLDRMPLTPNGKIDRKALPAPEHNTTANAAYVAPGSEIEKLVADIWEEVLGIERIGAFDHFFELGGHSLKAMTILSRVHQACQVEVPLRALFEHPILRDFAAYLESKEKSVYESIKPVEERDVYPVSSAQKRMYILQEFEGDGISYNIPNLLMLLGTLDRNRFEQAFRKLAARHEALRTSFHSQEGEPVQRIHGEVELPIAYTEATDAELPQIIEAFVQPFNLQAAPLCRLKLVKLEADRHLFLMDMHHIIADGVSLDILTREWMELYNGNELPPLQIQYKDYAIWQQGQFQSDRYRSQESYWLNTFAGEIPLLSVPTDYQRPAVQSFDGDAVTVESGKELMDRLQQLAAETETTLYMLLLAAYNVLLAKYAGQEEIVVGTPTAGRSHADVQNIVGMFVNTLALKNRPIASLTFREFLENVKQNTLEAFQHQDYPLENLLDALQIRRDLSRNPLFDTMFSLGNLESETEESADLKLSPYPLPAQIAKFDVSLDAAQGNEQLFFQFNYCTKLFAKATMERWAAHYLQILKAIVAEPDASLCAIDMLTDSEKSQLTELWNDTDIAYPMNTTFHQMFEAQANKTPDRIAVTFGEQQLTYRELNERANQVAHLLRSKGVKPESTVCIIVDRTLHMAVGVLAILKAGGAYVPIDPDYPQERQAFIWQDSQAQILVTEKKYENAIRDAKDVVLLDVEDVYQGERSNPEPSALPEHAAYIIYTSGTTGNPKGVVIEHRSYVNLAHAWLNEYRLDTFPVRLLQMASFAFDVSAGDFARAWLSGGELVICPNEVKMDPPSLYALLKTHDITIFESTPALIVPLMQHIYEKQLDISHMRLLILGADSCSMEDFRRLLGRFGSQMRIINSYGVTEACIDSSYFEQPLDMLPDLGTVPIGKPLPNTKMYILDANLQLQPIGVPGELCIGGAGVARGYLNRPELDAAKFVANPYIPGERLYRTGDMARWLADGNIEFLGRNDFQVKIRGVRIELSEIESHLRKQPGIREAVVVAREDHTGDKVLCAYMVADETVHLSEIRSMLVQHLPSAMIPSYFVKLDAMPLTANGKVDIRGLPQPDGSLMARKHLAPPRTLLEHQLCEVWKQVLQQEAVGIDDDFFMLGGHSMRAMTVITQMHHHYQVDLPLRLLFEKPTIREIAEHLSNAGTDQKERMKPAVKQAYYPLSSAQKRMFILDQFEGAGTTYNMPNMLVIEGDLDIPLLQDALVKLVQRHESLRTSFALVNGEPVQIIHDEVTLEIPVVHAEEEAVDNLVSQFVQPFDLRTAPLLRVKLVKVNESRHFLLLDTHHIISDGISSGILMEEWLRLYKGETLSPLPFQYKDFAVWQNAQNQSKGYEEQENYWLQVFDGDLPMLNMPTDYPRPALKQYEGNTVLTAIDSQLYHDLQEVSAQTGSTLFMVLLAAYQVLLSKYTGQEDIVVGTPIAGRSHAELDKVVGMFVNTLAIRSQPVAGMSFRDFLMQVKYGALQAYQHQDYPFEELVEKLAINRDLSRNPLFDTMFTLQSGSQDSYTLEALKISPYQAESTGNHAKFDITLIASEEQERLVFAMEYSTSLYKQSTIKRLIQHYQQILKQIATNMDAALGDIGMMTDQETQLILTSFNETAREHDPEATMQQLFERQVLKTPHHAALQFDGNVMTYHELNQRANRLARVLRQKGVGPDQLVAVITERSMEMVVGILAILKAGGAHVPIDPAYPEERIRYMLDDSSVGLVLCQAHLIQQLPDTLVWLDLNDDRNYAEDGSNLPNINQPNDLAYVIYTSGTTGQPKGVMIEHRGIANCLQWRANEYGFGPGDVVLQVFSFAFDGFVASLFAPLLGGAVAVIPEETDAKDPIALKKLMKTTGVTHYYGVPSLFQAILDCADADELQQLRCVTLGGEKLSSHLVQRTKQLVNDCEINNEYGPTENSVVSTIARSVDSRIEITIGRPVDNVQVYIVDKQDRLQPVGIAGELCVAGVGLARGYLNQPTLTAEKFVPNPFRPGERMYKTGDLAMWFEDGSIQFLGRMDEQVKIRGYRIELEEIEKIILDSGMVKDAVLVAREEERNPETYLCAYLVPEQATDLPELRRYLMQKLPAYMVPSYFVKLEQLPLTPNGKVDRKALPAPRETDMERSEYVAPRTQTEDQLVAVWQEVLGVAKIGIKDDFFELGGHSLKATLLVAKVFAYMQVELPLNLIFTHPTIEKMAAYLTEQKQEPTMGKPILLNQIAQRHLFAFTPIGAHSYFYQSLAEHLQGVSFYSLDFLAAEDRIEQYARAIVSHDPQGPYTLLGFSSGGNLAFEVAKELERLGRVVSDIVLFDSYWKDTIIERTREEMEQDIDQLFEEIGENTELFNMTKEDFQVYLQDETIRKKFVDNTIQYLQYHYQLIHTGSTKASIHLIQSADADEAGEAVQAAEWNQAAWTESSGRLLVYQGQGIHSRMLSVENIEKNADILVNILQEIYIV